MLVKCYGKCLKPLLACKFHFKYYFYLPLKSRIFNYRNLLMLKNNSVDIRHCNYLSFPTLNFLN